MNHIYNPRDIKERGRERERERIASKIMAFFKTQDATLSIPSTNDRLLPIVFSG